MTGFSTCPACQGIPDEDRGVCADCGGSGVRPATRENIELAVEAQEWAADQVSRLFDDWCKVSGTHPAYGVESWSLDGDNLRIVQDISCMGCYDTTNQCLPSAWLFATGEERKNLMLEYLEREAQEAAARQKSDRAREIENLKSRLARLEGEAPDASPKP